MSSTTAQRRPVRVVVNLLFAVLMTFGVSAAIAPAAQAAPQAECWTPTANGEGRGYIYYNSNYGVNLKGGPYTNGCWNTGWADSGSMIYLHCWTKNSYGNTWWYVRIAGTGVYGWTSEDNFWGDSIDENGDGQIVFYQC